MRRRSWEEKGGDDDDLDHPVTVTEKQLRSLERGAKLGLFGLILALIAIGVAGWTMFRTLTKPPAAPQTIAAAPAPAAVDTAAAHPAAVAPTPAPATPTPAPAVASAPVGGPAAVIPKAKTHSVRATNAVARRGSHATHAARSATSPTPKMESFDPGPAPAAAVPTPTPTPTPVPVPVEHKAAPADTSNH